MSEYTMGYNAGLECAASLLTSGELRAGITLTELAEQLRMMQVKERECVRWGQCDSSQCRDQRECIWVRQNPEEAQKLYDAKRKQT